MIRDAARHAIRLRVAWPHHGGPSDEPGGGAEPRPVRSGRAPIAAGLAAAAVSLLGIASMAAAQISVEVSPLRVELQAAPGGTTTQAVSLTNAGMEPVRVRARVADWDLSRDGTPQFEGVPEGDVFSATDWVRVAPPEQLLDPAKEATVRFSLLLPPDVPPGGYRTAVLFEFLPAASAPAGRQVQFRSRVATLIYVNVGQPQAHVELTDVRIRPLPQETQIIAIVRNTSRRTIRTKGVLALYDAAGGRVREVPLPDVPLLPEREREIAIPAVAAEKPLPPGDYRVEVRLDAGMPALLVGETTLAIPR